MMTHRCSGLLVNQAMSRLCNHTPIHLSLRTLFLQPQNRYHRKRMLLKLSQHKPVVVRMQSQSSPKNGRLIHITPVSVLVSALMSALMFATYVWLERSRHLQDSAKRTAALAESGLGTLDWSLADQNGKRRQYSEFRGQWLILYFGFCHCPDICPEELEKLVDVVQGIDKNSSTPDIQPIFITLDPARDTVQYMNKYCKDFSPKLIGFTGTVEEIAAVAKSYKVYYSLGEKDADGDYIVDHTICMYLINPDGQLVDVYERRAKVEGIVKGSLQHISDYHKLKSKFSLAS